jgi:hypothetical protein
MSVARKIGPKRKKIPDAVMRSGLRSREKRLKPFDGAKGMDGQSLFEVRRGLQQFLIEASHAGPLADVVKANNPFRYKKRRP